MRNSAPKHEILQKGTVDKPPAHTYSNQLPKTSFRNLDNHVMPSGYQY